MWLDVTAAGVALAWIAGAAVGYLALLVLLAWAWCRRTEDSQPRILRRRVRRERTVEDGRAPGHDRRAA